MRVKISSIPKKESEKSLRTEFHDLKNNLTAISLPLELLKLDLPPEKKKKIVTDISRKIKETIELVNKMSEMEKSR